MANVLKIKKNSTWDSTSNPSNSDVVYGELAWANGTKRLYIGRQSTSGGAVTATRIGGEVGLANDNIVKLDEACSSGEVAVFGSTGLTGRTVTEFKSDLVLGTTSAANFASVTTTGDNTVGANLAVTGNITVTGNLQVNGSTTTVNSTTMTVDDPILTLGGDTAPGSDDNKDRGVEFRYHDGSNAKIGFFGWDDSNSRFVFYKDATNTSEVFSGTVAGIQANLIGNVTGNADTATTLATARTIGGVSFDGSANINLPGVNAAGNQNTTGNSANVTGVVAVANGGTGANSASGALANLGYTGATDANNFAMTVSHNAGTAAAFASGSTLNITGSSGITVNRTNSSYTFSIDTSSVCTLDATQILTNKTIDGGTF